MGVVLQTMSQLSSRRHTHDEARAWTAQPQDGGGDFLRRSHAANRLILQKGLHGLRVISLPIGVSTQPGHIALTRIPCAATSIAALFVRPITPCLLA
jgi:hypothetical protein